MHVIYSSDRYPSTPNLRFNHFVKAWRAAGISSKLKNGAGEEDELSLFVFVKTNISWIGRQTGFFWGAAQRLVRQKASQDSCLEPVRMTHPILTQQPLKSNPTLTPKYHPPIGSMRPEQYLLPVLLICWPYLRGGPISVHPVRLESGSSLSTWHYLNLAVSSPRPRPSVPQTHRLGSDFQITLEESSVCGASTLPLPWLQF